jgi:FkbM family methyltransferase
MRVWIEFCELFNPRFIADIGANTGIYGLVAKSLNEKCEVSFFEPLESASKIIDENLKLNDYKAKNFKLALSNYDGEGKFFLNNGADFLYSITLNEFSDLAILGNHNSEVNYTTMESKVSKFSTLIESELVHIPNLVKLDVETHEPEVLEGFGFDLEKVDAYLIEVLNNDAAKKLNELFRGTIFKIFNLNDENLEVYEYAEFKYTGCYNYFVVKPNLAREMKTLKNR